MKRIARAAYAFQRREARSGQVPLHLALRGDLEAQPGSTPGRIDARNVSGARESAGAIARFDRNNAQRSEGGHEGGPTTLLG